MFFSAANNGFYNEKLKGSYYDKYNAWPADAVELTEAEVAEFSSGTPPAGKMLGADSTGMPAWLDVPPPTHEEQIEEADAKKQQRIEQVNSYMSSKQWPGKAAMGRLTDEEKVKYNAWLDYLDALEAVDTASVPDINWPDEPEA